MRTQIDTIKRLFFLTGILLTIGSVVSAQSYQVYLCGDGTATFTPDFGSYVPQVGDEVIWIKVDGGTNTTVETIPVADPSTDEYTLTVSGTGLAAGEHAYHVYVLSAEGCSSDPSSDLAIYKLPESTLSVTADLASYCADNSGTPTQSVLTALPSVAGGATLPPDVTYSYTWSATQDGNAVTDLTTIGVEAGDEFTLNSTTAGSYVFTATAAYTVSAGIIKSGSASAGCPVSDTETVTVTEKPTTPTIIVN